jgi:hypothetical protein
MGKWMKILGRAMVAFAMLPPTKTVFGLGWDGNFLGGSGAHYVNGGEESE